MKRATRFVAQFTLVFIVVTSYSCLYTPQKWKPIYRVEFRGEIGWIRGTVSYKSLDNGRIWRQISLPIGGPFAIVDQKLAFSAPDGYLKMTTDGGATWSDLHRNRKSLALPFFMLDPAVGFGRDHDLGGMYRTQDGGRSWHQIEEFGGADMRELVLSEGVVYGLVGGRSLFKSTDGGLSWREGARFPTHVEAMSSSGGSLWFVGWDGMCSAYDLKKGTLQDFPFPTEKGMNSIAGNRGILIAVGDDGSLFVSKVIPPAWSKVDLEITDTLRDVAFSDDGTAFVVGGDYDDLLTGWANRVALKSTDYLRWEEVELP